MKKLIFSALLAGSIFTFGAAFTSMPKASTPPADGITGTIVETMNTAGYTYMLLDGGSSQTWVAIPETTVQKGAKVTCSAGMEMKNFKSTTLDRTFPSIIFSTGLADTSQQKSAEKPSEKSATNTSFKDAVAAEQKSEASQGSAMGMSGGSAGAVVPLSDIHVDKAQGPNGYTVAEVFDKSKELNGKKLKIRGKVVKFNASIMGRNWIHLQDGTGNPMNNTHDLVVTSSGTAQVNDTIVVEGILAADKDFGSGYAYSAILEESVITK